MTLKMRDLENIEKGKEEGFAQGHEQGLAQGREQGLAQGREQGLAQGERFMSRLMQALLSENRYDDLKKIATDSDYRNQLYHEYGIV